MKEWPMASFPPPLTPHFFVHSRMTAYGCVSLCLLQCMYSSSSDLTRTTERRVIILCCGLHSCMYVMSECVRLTSGSSSSWVIRWENWRRGRPIGVRLGGGCGRSQLGVGGWGSRGGIFQIPGELSVYCCPDRGFEWMAMQVWLLVLS